MRSCIALYLFLTMTLFVQASPPNPNPMLKGNLVWAVVEKPGVANQETGISGQCNITNRDKHSIRDVVVHFFFYNSDGEQIPGPDPVNLGPIAGYKSESVGFSWAGFSEKTGWLGLEVRALVLWRNRESEKCEMKLKGKKSSKIMR